MSAKTEEKLAPPEVYKMPFTYKGQMVLWYEHGRRKAALASPAIVQQVNDTNVQVLVFLMDGTMRIIENARWMGDPSTNQEDRMDSGRWDYLEDGTYGGPEFEEK